MKQNYERRLEKLESNPSQQWRDVRCLICQGKYYDELTAEQQTRYCEYIGTTPEAFADCNLAVTGSLHIRLESKPDPPTPSKLREIIKQIQSYLKGD